MQIKACICTEDEALHFALCSNYQYICSYYPINQSILIHMYLVSLEWILFPRLIFSIVNLNFYLKTLFFLLIKIFWCIVRIHRGIRRPKIYLVRDSKVLSSPADWEMILTARNLDLRHLTLLYILLLLRGDWPKALLHIRLFFCSIKVPCFMSCHRDYDVCVLRRFVQQRWFNISSLTQDLPPSSSAEEYRSCRLMVSGGLGSDWRWPGLFI